eukprot:4809904-Pleurochrysis_carterae.AAC.1
MVIEGPAPCASSIELRPVSPTALCAALRGTLLRASTSSLVMPSQWLHALKAEKSFQHVQASISMLRAWVKRCALSGIKRSPSALGTDEQSHLVLV